jgi:hypothetical protein
MPSKRRCEFSGALSSQPFFTGLSFLVRECQNSCQRKLRGQKYAAPALGGMHPEEAGLLERITI